MASNDPASDPGAPVSGDVRAASRLAIISVRPRSLRQACRAARPP
jgi:hypothetical protein